MNYSLLVESVLKELEDRNLEVAETLQSMSLSDKPFESEYFRNRLEGVLKDINATTKNASKIIKQLNIRKDNEALELMKLKRTIEE